MSATKALVLGAETGVSAATPSAVELPVATEGRGDRDPPSHVRSHARPEVTPSCQKHHRDHDRDSGKEITRITYPVRRRGERPHQPRDEQRGKSGHAQQHGNEPMATNGSDARASLLRQRRSNVLNRHACMPLRRPYARESASRRATLACPDHVRNCSIPILHARISNSRARMSRSATNGMWLNYLSESPTDRHNLNKAP